VEGIFLSEERKKRAVAVEKKISELTADDIRVKVIGAVIEKDESNNSFLIDDGQAKLRILVDQAVFGMVEIGKFVRVTGIVAPGLVEGSSVELRGEIVQDFSKLDKELYTKFLSLKSSD
jgi:hypothetical protein